MGRLAFATLKGLSREVRLRRYLAAAAVGGLLSVACTNPVDLPNVATVSIRPVGDSVEVGSVLTSFIASGVDAKGQEVTGRPITWKVSDPTVASVDANGKVTGLQFGATLLVATIGGRPSNPVVVKVLAKATRIIVVPDSIDVNLNGQKGLNAAVFDVNGSPLPGRVVTWASANPLVAAVAPGGTVTAISVGETTVTATVGVLSATVKVRVIPERVAAVRIVDPLGGSYILRLTKSIQVSAVALGVQNQPLTGRIFSWTSSNPAVATVSNSGVVTGNSLGQATITVESEGLQDQMQILVTQIPIASVTISPTDPTYFVGQNAQLVAILKDSAGNALSTVGRSVLWTNSNATVANVNAAGVINAISRGTTTVQVIVDQVASAPITVTVNQLPVISVVVTPQAQQIKVGVSVQFQAVLRDINGNVLGPRPTTWVSSDPSIATVSANGLVQGIAVGVVTITATSEGVPGSALTTIIP